MRVISNSSFVLCLGTVLLDGRTARACVISGTGAAARILFSEVAVVKGSLMGLLALVSVIIAAFSFYKYIQAAQTLWIALAIIFLVAALGLGGVFLSGRVNKADDIHITE